MTKPVNGPAFWSEVLSYMPPGAIVAGGAVRDFMLGKEPKDIDVFINYRSNLPFISKEIWNNYLNQNIVVQRYPCIFYYADVEGWIYDGNTLNERLQNPISDEYSEKGDIVAIEDLIYKDHKINIIYLKDIEPLEYMYGFDLGITRCLYDGNLFYTQDFINDFVNKTVTDLRGDGEWTKKRAERFIEKNKEFNFVEYKSPENTPAVS